MSSEIVAAIKQICDEKNLPYDSVLESIEYALAAAYRKDFGEKDQNIKAEFNPETGGIKVFDEKTVVDKPVLSEEEMAAKTEWTEEELAARFNAKTEIQLADAKEIKAKAKLDDILRIELQAPTEFGRVAAQTAKQVIIQRLKEVEKGILFEQFKDRENTMATGVIQRREGPNVLVDVENITAIMPPEEQVRFENYTPGQKMKFLIARVSDEGRGPAVIVSRASANMVRELFAAEIPEVQSGVVEIKSVAREAGSRSKVAVASSQSNIDPIGSCVGQRGSRVQTIISELEGEKLDIIEYSDDTKKFITNALSPAKVISIDLDDAQKLATVKVDASQLSLAIGRGGQNVRLASHLTGWRIAVEGLEGEKIEVGEAGEATEVVNDAVEGVDGEAENEISADGAEVEIVAPEFATEVAEEKPKKAVKKKVVVKKKKVEDEEAAE